MARKPQVRFFESRNAFYCQHQGKQHKLADGPDDSPTGPNYLAALTAFRQILELGNIEHAKDRNTVRAVLETYLQHKEGKMKASTISRRVLLFKPFCEIYGDSPVGSLTHFQVYKFLADMRQPRKVEKSKRLFAWGDGASRMFLETVNAAFNWAVKSKLLTVNPLTGIEFPSVRSRSRECVLTPEQHQKILRECRADTLRNVCIALENSGARPCEIAAATARDWDDEMGAIVYYGDDRRRQDEFRHKSAAYKDRVIYFTGEALEMIRRLVKKNPTGQIFRTRQKGGYTGQAISNGFRPVRERLKMPKLTPYSYRHTFATRWLLSGRSIEVLAELLGNTANTIRKHYAHLCSDRPRIRRQLEEFMKAEESEKTPAVHDPLRA